MSSAVGLLFEAQTAQHFVFLSSVFQLGRSPKAIGVVRLLFTSKVILSLFPTVREKIKRHQDNTVNKPARTRKEITRKTSMIPLTV